MKTAAVLLLSVIIISCTSTKPPETKKQPAAFDSDSNAIVFVVLKIRKDSAQGKNIIEVVSKTQSAGIIKNKAQTRTDPENYLTIDTFKNDSLFSTMTMEHPLLKRIEYIDDKNTLQSKSIELDTEEFFIRLHIKGKSNWLRISETLKNGLKKELTTIQL
ncbi:MAG: hypothetical protein V4642_10325 [Bacteroidota bacterium]